MNTTERRILYLFTRTPLHVGAGSSVGAIDQPIQRERHTGFPIIPGSSIKGVLRDALNASDATWLFGSADAHNACAGAVQTGEGRLLAFPVRSAGGCFAWIVSPLVINRFARDTGMCLPISGIDAPAADKALFASEGLLGIGAAKDIVLEDYTFRHTGELPGGLASAFARVLPDDTIWADVAKRLVVVSDEMMNHFAIAACEVAQHIRIEDATGTVAPGALFNQENVPSETLFYAPMFFFDERRVKESDSGDAKRSAGAAATELVRCLPAILQIGADASTGLGYVTAKVGEVEP